MFIRRALNGWLVPSVLFVVVVGGLAAVAARRNLFMVQGNQIRMDDANRNITFTQGKIRKF